MMLLSILSIVVIFSNAGLKREIMWVSLDGRTYEHLRLRSDERGIVADGLILRLNPKGSSRFTYTIRCDSSWRFRSLMLRNLDEPARFLELQCDGNGNWGNGRGEAIPSLKGCRDIDIYYSPFTNTVAIRRLALKLNESAETAVAFVGTADMSVTAVRQRYTLLESNPDRVLYLYESDGSGFSAELSVDSDGLVIEYPGFFRRAWSR